MNAQTFLWAPATAFALTPTLCTCEDCLAVGFGRTGEGQQLQLSLATGENDAPASSPASASRPPSYCQPENVLDR